MSRHPLGGGMTRPDTGALQESYSGGGNRWFHIGIALGRIVKATLAVIGALWLCGVLP